jgi:hypothetical protein
VTIPEIAERLREKARELNDGELMELADAMRRRRPVKRAEPTSRRMTGELRVAIREYAKAHPEKSQLEIGVHFGVNPGRVSESIRGFRR